MLTWNVSLRHLAQIISYSLSYSHLAQVPRALLLTVTVKTVLAAVHMKPRTEIAMPTSTVGFALPWYLAGTWEPSYKIMQHATKVKQVAASLEAHCLAQCK